MLVKFLNFVTSIYALTVFLLGCLLLTISGFFIFLFKTSDKKKLLYHKLLCRTTKFVILRIPRVKTTYSHFDRKIFEKPAVIISNHQSHLDLMCIMSLTPKVVILTNDWVWNSPYFGKMIRYADFYPVSNGIENAITQLQTIVEKGYSVMVFPEGTRSEDCSIQRFHKGAFYLSEKLKLDIIPVLLYGAGQVLPKKKFMLHKGKIHIKVFDRILYNDNRFGETDLERAKNFRKFYQKEAAINFTQPPFQF